MYNAVPSEYLSPFDGTFLLESCPTTPPEDAPSDKKCRKQLEDVVEEIGDLQRILYAHDQYSILLVFQAMDAAGKDSTIRSVLTGVNPAGCQVHAFKQPSSKELDHDFLWRTSKALPERGRIGVFNRSYYEEVLVVRVHPDILSSQKIPKSLLTEDLWESRLRSIREFEEHLTQNGTIVLKFWLNVSRKEQTKRFISRIEEPEKHWKFSDRDVIEQRHWDSYMQAYQEAIRHTSQPAAPWYAIPADNKPFMRLTVATLIRDSLKQLNIHYPKVSKERKEELKQMKRHLTEMQAQ